MAQDANAKSAPTLGSLCLIDRLKRARDFPHNTCAASRHAEMIGKEMLRKEGETTEAESILATVAALYEARTALAERRWIPVSERLPEDNSVILGFRRGFPGVFECCYEGGEWTNGGSVTYGGAAIPTH